ncbi:sulfite exporter TauE/SafE family protein [Alcanivorax sp. 1008]|uniref:sulfite exporter TauE/SafE family protein n=1 Tax=Alcanivorax sp. 1008 TaxID=2816853 RepID=UPI001DE2C425|nr:sulfite exporter TauE/SafE family protein [Alcanivorax sp. 1008]MCC1496011.1 sulfite exporter TauE/SafE family protein [Alcanivorax sp. 1008]
MEYLWLLAIFILFAYTVEAVTGFGSIVIALSLGALLMPVPELLPILVPLNILMTGWLTSRLYRNIDVQLLLRRIVPLMLTGTLLGYLLLPWLSERWLKPLFGLLILWFSARELWRLNHGGAVHHPKWLTPPLMFSAGITHGLFASGGPLLVYALAGTSLDKARFRATLIAVWFLLNSSLTIAFLLDGRLQSALPAVLMLAPLLPVGVWLGEKLHHRIDEGLFRKLVYGLLMVTGSVLLGAGLLA